MKLMEIKDVITQKLIDNFPGHNIYVEENVLELLKPALVVRVYPISMAIENKYHRRKFINLQVYYHSQNGTNEEDLNMIDALYEVFDPVLVVQDRVLPVGVIHTRVKDNILRLSFNLDFIDSIDERKSYGFEEHQLMEELEMKEEF